MGTTKNEKNDQEIIKAQQNNPGVAIEEPITMGNETIEEPMSVEDIQDTVDLINPDDNSMNSRG